MMIDDDVQSPVVIEAPPTTPGRPPSPRMFDEKDNEDNELIPVPPPPRESQSVPTNFLRPQFRRRASLDVSSLPSSALPSRNGSPTWRRPASGWSKMTTQRSSLPRLYAGKDEPAMMLSSLGSFGPGFYEVKKPPITGTPRFGSGERFDRTKAYEGKENTAMMRGQFGPGMYDVKRPPIAGTPRFGTGERFDRSKMYEGKENTATMLGQFGPGMYDVKRPPIAGTPRFGSGERFDRSKAYEGKENTATMRGQFGPGMYEVTCSNRGSPLIKGRRPSIALAPLIKGRRASI